MNRTFTRVLGGTAAVAVLAACGGDAQGCEELGADPNANVYQLTYAVNTPSRCPVPLARPGEEKKFVGATLTDTRPKDFDQARVVVRNSKGEEVADEIVYFLPLAYDVNTSSYSSWQAVPRGEYVAATGTGQVSDYDIAEFSGYASATKLQSGKLKITYKSSNMSASVSGERIPPANTTHTWNAPTTGGYPGYMYQWYRDGNPVGTGPSYTGATGTADFDLRVEVSDQTWSMVAAVLSVDVGGVAASISGPSSSWASENGSTWTAAGRGGTGVYTFNWYLDGDYVGSGPTWQGFPGENGHTLRVDMQDSSGAHDSESLFVVGIGGGSEPCDPPPGQLRCVS